MAYGSYTPAMNLYDMIGGIADPIVSNLQAMDKRNTLSALGEQLQKGDFEGATATALRAGDIGTGLKIMELGRTQKADTEAFKSLGSLGSIGATPAQPSPIAISPAANPPVFASGQDTSGIPRGLRNFNPGNIENGRFAQSQPGYVGSDGRFAKFDSIDSGVNAQASLLDSYGRKGINTISGIVNRWAPSAENGAATGNYATFVAKKLGVDPNAPIDIANPDTRRNIALAMAEFENGRPVRIADASGAVPQSAAPQPAAQIGSEIEGLLARRQNIMRALGTAGISDSARQRLDTLLRDTEFLLSRADKEANRSPVALGEGQILVDPRTGRQIATGGQRNDVAKANSQREAEANRLGIQGEERLQYITSGKIPTQAEKQTGEQANAATFATRMNEADKILSDPAIYGSGMGARGMARDVAASIPIVGNTIVGSAEGGAQYQQYDQAKRDFVNAVLRKESGAAISSGEFSNAEKQYFPRPGDTPEVIAQKAKNRATAIDTIANGGTPSFKKEFAAKRRGAAESRLKPAPEQEISGARRALAAGVPRDVVMKQLRDLGFDAGGL